MHSADLRAKPVSELEGLLKSERQLLARLREKASQGALKEVRKILVHRKTIAQILTILAASKAGARS